MTATAALVRTVRAGYAPPPLLTVSEFSDAELVVATGPRAGTHWKTDFAPYQRGIMDAFHEPGVEVAVVMCSSQVGKTTCAVNVVAYHVAWDPCPILVVEPTVEMARDFSKNRLDPMIAASPILHDTVSKKRAKDSSNTVLAKTYRGGALSIGGANSAASLAARSIRLLIMDEIDRYPPELAGEGSTISIALKRTAAYHRRSRVLMLSSPTIVNAPIHSWFERGDQRRYHVPCPACGVMHRYEWKNVRWDSKTNDPATARLYCPSCDHGIDDVERVEALQYGEWRAENSERTDLSVISFHVWEAYSPMSSLPKIVAGFIYARAAQKAGDRAEMHTWQNTTLGEPIELESGEGVDPDPLLVRREDYGGVDVPAGACLLTMGVDTQDDRLEALVVAWGPGEESWIVDRDMLPGDPVGPEPWAMLDQFLAHEYMHESGQRLPITATCIDSAGHRTDAVYDYCHLQAARRVYATIGRDGNRPIIASPSQPRKRVRAGRKVPLYTVGVDAAKALFMSRLRKAAPEEGESWDGYVHIPNKEWADEELIAQLTSERLVTRFKSGFPVTRWKRMRARNEALDMAVLAMAALRIVHPDLDLLSDRLMNPAAPEPKKKPAATRKPFLGKRRKDWLRKR